MSSGSRGDQPIGEVDKNGDQWTTLLKGLGLRVPLETVRKVAIQVVSQAPLHPLYASRKGTIPVAGKGTVYKIRRLIEDGSLDPLLIYWGLTETPEINPLQLAHLSSLKMFLQEDSRIRDSFSIAAPDHKMEWMLKQLVPRAPHIWLLVCHFSWEDLPIISKIRSHCPENQLWKDMDEWKRRQDEYERLILHIAEKLQKEFYESLHFPGSEVINPTLERQLLLDIFKWLAGQLLGNVPPSYGGFYTYVMIQNDKVFMDNISPSNRGLYDAYKGQIAWGSTCYAYGAVAQTERARRIGEDALKRWSDSDDLRLLVRQYYSLKILVQRIMDDIEHIDEAVLAQGSCPDCPTLSPNKKQKID